MAWIWVTLAIEGFLSFIGFIFFFLPGRIAKFIAVPIFIFILPVTAGRDVIWNISDSGTGTYITLVLPALYALIRFATHVMIVMAAIWNWFDEIDRDLLGRDKETKKYRRRKK
jgi:hypothetical protein